MKSLQQLLRAGTIDVAEFWNSLSRLEFLSGEAGTKDDTFTQMASGQPMINGYMWIPKKAQHPLLGRLQQTDPASTATVHYRFLHEGILRTFLSRVGEQARDTAVYWKYGCWFWEETTRSAILVQSSRGHPTVESV